ncbi:MAG TPA: DUF58 domain-containing protein [Elusimicrobia bacterium]|nr:DUF58 domain-containing protein [Elusimicrobiota bacterium]
MLPKEILAQVRRIEIRTGRLVNDVFAGKYLSVFKGRGMEFSQVREYTPGDDIRDIDWNVSARQYRLFVRQYQEERELTLMVACDLSGSQFFGSGQKLKREVAAELCGVLAFSALKNSDKVGLFLFSDGRELFIPPRKGRLHVLKIIRDVLAYAPERKGTDIAASLDTLNRMLKRRSILMLVSDFQAEGFEKALRRTARKHDLIPVVVEDPREEDLPALPAWLDFEDPETGERALVRPDAALRRELRARRAVLRARLTEAFRSAHVDPIHVRTDESYVEPIVRYFHERSRRFR